MQIWQKGGVRKVVINIRGFPDDLHRETKIQAAVEGTTIKNIIIKALREYLDRAKKGGR